eukprot:CAMPEP_0170893236 /NCGR_PEP_ID=MMETSP0734-20130129/42305_1 /TAXON_ID=186038 /ORGANISM="Fragilariopsis kerguelensis, Strain L26-C5" /LENGTH=135 /DNA_ID=CAMNT_0011283701 /DNA_START=734 /DNA_END=1137 /DNA_ORIENTATION=+
MDDVVEVEYHLLETARTNTFSMENMNDLGLFVNGDDDQTLFELDDLEDNIDLIVNQKPERSAGPSAYLNHLGTSSHYSDPSSWLKNQDHAFINPDSGTSSSSHYSDPSSWLKNQDHAFINPDSGTSLRLIIRIHH